MPGLRLTLIQSPLHWENKEANLSLFEKKIEAIRDETDLIVLPEMFPTGFTMQASAQAETMEGQVVEWMRKMSAKKNCVITGSVIISDENRYYNRLLWSEPGRLLFYDKRHLFRLTGEEKTYSQGNYKILPELKGWKILPLICYDLRFPVWSRRTAKENFDLLIYVANWPEKRVYAWNQLLIARAIENQCYVAGLNRIGNDGNGIYHSGESAVINFRGEKMIDLKNEESIQTCMLEEEPLKLFRRQFAFFEDRDEFSLL